ncbi:hypothetical protein HK101_004415, partial [Irineochytrium annulatum]
MSLIALTASLVVTALLLLAAVLVFHYLRRHHRANNPRDLHPSIVNALDLEPAPLKLVIDEPSSPKSEHSRESSRPPGSPATPRNSIGAMARRSLQGLRAVAESSPFNPKHPHRHLRAAKNIGAGGGNAGAGQGILSALAAKRSSSGASHSTAAVTPTALDNFHLPPMPPTPKSAKETGGGSIRTRAKAELAQPSDRDVDDVQQFVLPSDKGDESNFEDGTWGNNGTLRSMRSEVTRNDGENGTLSRTPRIELFSFLAPAAAGPYPNEDSDVLTLPGGGDEDG